MLKKLNSFKEWKLWCDGEGYWCELKTDCGIVTEFGTDPERAVDKAIETYRSQWQAVLEARRDANQKQRLQWPSASRKDW